MRFSFSLIALLHVGIGPCSAALSVADVRISTLGTDPEGSARLNGMSFQQDALTTFNGWQYVAYYEATGTYNRQNIVLGRRNLQPDSNANGVLQSPTQWELLKFTDYVQQTQDSHNTISMGISADGRIHLSYDHHDVPLNYRVSNDGIALEPEKHSWTTSLFGTTLHSLPGAGAGPWRPVTYPRFETVGDDFLFEMRIGQSGSGDNYIYRYTAGSWTSIGRYMQGQNNNGYINGLERDGNGTLHVSWTWRETPDVVTNHDLGYASSTDLGRTWRASSGETLGSTIRPGSVGAIVYRIPQRSGILNQEAQAAFLHDSNVFHVLNRETVGATLTWMHYRRETNGTWTKRAIENHGLGPLTQTGRRGKLAVHPETGDLLAILASNTGSDVAVLVSEAQSGFSGWRQLWKGTGYDVEPLIDREAWRGSGGIEGGKMVSLFLNTAGGYPERKVTVVDIVLEG